MDWKDKRVLVCGGAGLIGSHLARRLLSEGAAVTVADDLSSGSEKNIRDIAGDIVFVQEDLRSRETCLRVTKGQDAVFQLAANMGGMLVITSVHAPLMRGNALININMLESARRNEVPLYFYSSSACIYPNYKQTTPDVVGLREEDAIPAEPQEATAGRSCSQSGCAPVIRRTTA
jgi:GDP-D-mannose 3',5'-epimerase